MYVEGFKSIEHNSEMDKTLRYMFARKIKLERAKRDWTQEALADYANVSRSVMGHIERAEYSTTLDTIEKLAKALGVEPKELFDFEDIK